MKIKLILICCIATLFTTSCENEIDINAPWIETPVIYGLLDAGFDVQYIRIQKTYQNDANTPTSATARISDSLYFDSLAVFVTSGNERYEFRKDSSIAKEPGFFTTNNHTFYKCVGFRPVVGRKYQLEVRNLISGKLYRANTSIVGTASLATPNPTIIYNPMVPAAPFQLVMIPGQDIRINDAGLRLYYLEYPTNNPSASSVKHVDHMFFSGKENIAPGSRNTLRERMDIIMNSFEEFLPRNPSITRKLSKIDAFWLAGGEDLKLIIELSKPSQFLVQRKPEFSNIDNGGLGVFTSRASSFFPIQYSDTTAQNISERLGFEYP